MYLCIWGAKNIPIDLPKVKPPFFRPRGEDRSSLEGRHQGCGVRGAWPRHTPGTGDWTGALAKTSLESCGILWNPVRCSGFHREYGDFPWEFSDPTKTIVIFRMKKNGPFCVMILGWGIPGNRPYEFVWTGYTMCPPFQRIMIDNPREGDGEVCGNWWGPLFLPNNCF